MQSLQEIIQSESVSSGEPRPSLKLEKNSDYDLLRRAIRNRWPVDLDLKRQAVETALNILQNGREDKDKLNAVKVLVEMDKINQTDSLYEDKCRRIDEGMATEMMGVAPVVIRQPVKMGKIEDANTVADAQEIRPPETD